MKKSALGCLSPSALALLSELEARSPLALPRSASLGWTVPSHSVAWQRRFRMVALCGLCTSIRSFLVALTLPCLLSLIALQMRLPCTDTHAGLTCTLWLNLTLITVLIVLVSLARAPSPLLCLLSQVAGGCDGFREALAR